MKKFLSLVLSVMLVATCMLTGCGNKEAKDGDSTTLRIAIYDRGDVPAGAGTITDNAMTKWAQENFGNPNNIKLEYVSIPRQQETSQLNVLMAAKQAPDIIFTYSYATMYNYSQDGGLTDLGKYLDEHGTELKAFLGEEVLEQGVIDGKQFLIPAKRLIRGTTAQLIRQDWLDKLGLEVPTNKEELYNVLKAFKEKDPGNVGEKLIPFAYSTSYAQYRDLLYSFIDTEGMDELTVKATPEQLRPGYKEGMRFLNKLYNEGLTSPDFALDKDRKQMETAIANGYVGFFNDDLGRPLQKNGVYETLKKTVPEAKLTAVDVFNDKNGNYPKRIYTANGLFIGVPSFSKNTDAALKYLNWLADADVMFTLQYGIEGRNYELDEDGFPVTLDTEEAKKTHWYNLGFDMELVVNGKYIKNEELSVKFNAMSTIEPQLYLDCYENSIRDGWVDIADTTPPTEADNKYQTNFNAKMTELYTKPVMAAPEDFDKVFDSIIKEAHELGGDEMIAARKIAYKDIINK